MAEDTRQDEASAASLSARSRDRKRLTERVATLEAENRELTERIEAMLASTSWRATRPVRVAIESFRRRAGNMRRAAADHADAHISPAADEQEPAPTNPKSFWLLDTELFDVDYYREAAKLGPVDDLAAAEHYVSEGEALGLRPNPSFDPLVYADFNREVSGVDVGLLLHYAGYGRAEGRVTTFAPDRDIHPGRRTFDPSRSTVLLVCHEATRTGAPILGWNLARELSQRHNLVIAVLEPEGDLFDLFVGEACFVVGPFRKDQLKWVPMARFGRHLHDRFDFDHAIANSIECQPLLVGLAIAGVPTVTLVHEFPAGVAGEARMQAGMRLSSQVVFDARSQHAAALACWPGITPRNQHVFHQGASEVPADPNAPVLDAEALAAKRDVVFRAVRGDGSKPVVLGLGTVSMRKAPDLFVACAQATVRRLGPGGARFVWIGHTPQLPPEGRFGDWLADQARRSGLGSDLVFLDAVDDLEGAYAATDAVMISSRLDPFPNVAMDAALKGIPVVCFAEANGFAEYLAADPATAALSVAYLDVDAAGAALAGVLAEPERRRAIGDALQARALRDFSMRRYMERLAPLVDGAKAIAAQERRDVALLLADDTFSVELWKDPGEYLTREETVRLHVRIAASGQEANQYCRRPALGFVPQTYADHHPDLDRMPFPNPLAHWIRAGKPCGPWAHPVLVPEREPAATRPDRELKVALHLHFHYPELAEPMLASLMANEFAPDLFVSTTSDDKAEQLRLRLVGYDRGSVLVEACPNRGRDIGPMLSRFAGALQRYDVFGHIHGKRSLALTSVGLGLDVGTRWHTFLMEHLVGARFAMADLIMARFAASDRLGLVFPEDPNLTGWSLDREIARDLARRMDPAMEIPHSIDFPIGTMFWARPAALKPLFDLGLDWDDYPEEPVPIDGTMLHALERLLPVIAGHAGFDIMTTHVPGVTR